MLPVLIMLAAAGCGASSQGGAGAASSAPGANPASGATGIGQPAAPAAAPATAPAQPASTISQSPAAQEPAGSASAPVTAWTRPLNVQTLPPAGIFKAVSQTPSPGEKVPLFFMGAQFCPYCAAERWALVEALRKFGTLSGFGQERSNDGIDGFKPVPTYDLRPARYDSLYVAFSDKEIYDHNSKPLDPLSSDEKTYVDRYDPTGGWPFMVINGQYAGLGPGFSPGLLQGQTFETVAGQLQRGEKTPATEAITNEAQIIARYICAATGGAPASACPA